MEEENHRCVRTFIQFDLEKEYMQLHSIIVNRLAKRTKLPRIHTFSPINFPMKLSTDKHTHLAIEEYLSKKVPIRF